MKNECALIESPVGDLLISTDAEGVCEIRFETRLKEEERADRSLRGRGARGGGLVGETTRQLAAYFRGELEEFDLPIAPVGTRFQRRVWDALRQIRYGETISYGELARRIGNPKASRAVGAANGRNPLPIVIPCHRVIGADGTLTGFGGGLPIKEKLLEHERARTRMSHSRARPPVAGGPR